MPFALFTYKWILGGVVVAGLGAALWVQTARLSAAQTSHTAATQIATQWRTNFEAMEATNAANVRALETVQAEAARIEAEANIARQHTARLSLQYENLRQRLRHATDDRPVGPVLCRTLNELRALDGNENVASICGD